MAPRCDALLRRQRPHPRPGDGDECGDERFSRNQLRGPLPPNIGYGLGIVSPRILTMLVLITLVRNVLALRPAHIHKGAVDYVQDRFFATRAE